MDKIKADVAEKGDIGTVAEVRVTHSTIYWIMKKENLF